MTAASIPVDAVLPPFLRLRWSGGRVGDKTRRQKGAPDPRHASPRPARDPLPSPIRLEPLAPQPLVEHEADAR
jgi:hypothetical protein